MRDRLAGVFGRPGELKGLGAVEGGRGADLTGLVRLLQPYSLVYTSSLLIGSSFWESQHTPAPFRTFLAAAPALSLGLVLPMKRKDLVSPPPLKLCDNSRFQTASIEPGYGCLATKKYQVYCPPKYRNRSNFVCARFKLSSLVDITAKRPHPHDSTIDQFCDLGAKYNNNAKYKAYLACFPP